MALNVNDVMDDIGAALETITGLRVFDFPPGSASPPFALLDLPESVTYDSTMARGADEASFPVTVAVGLVSDRSARDQLAEYMAGSGAKSIKAAVEAASIGQSARVSEARPFVITVGGVEFLGAVFTIDVLA